MLLPWRRHASRYSLPEALPRQTNSNHRRQRTAPQPNPDELPAAWNVRLLRIRNKACAPNTSSCAGTLRFRERNWKSRTVEFQQHPDTDTLRYRNLRSSLLREQNGRDTSCPRRSTPVPVENPHPPPACRCWHEARRKRLFLKRNMPNSPAFGAEVRQSSRH